MRLWLAMAFAAVGLITAALVYAFVTDSGEQAFSDRASELALGRTVGIAERIGIDPKAARDVIAGASEVGFDAWYFDQNRNLAARSPGAPELNSLDAYPSPVDDALSGRRYIQDAGNSDVIEVAVPVLDNGTDSGAVLSRYSRPEILQSAIDQLRSDSLRALVFAALVGILAGFIVATVITRRIKRLANSAERMADGLLDVPLEVSGRDEIGDLSRALDSMRSALKESFGVLTSDRDRLAAIFDGLTDAVMVVGNDGTVRFSNRAAESLLDEDGRPPEPMVGQLRRAALLGFSAHPAVRVGDRAYALQARDLPAEQAVLAIARDRTDEMRREWAERDFVSNAAHELRNPLAGISGAIEVLQSGAKDDPQARDHFLTRLAADAERMNRLTQSLLTLARVEAIGEGEGEIVDIGAAIKDVTAAVDPRPGLELKVEVEPDLAAQGDPTLLRQVMLGLITNALKNTPAPGVVTVRCRLDENEEVVLEVIDTGIGIPSAELERVFERFYRRSESRKQEGFGLGLAIARRMVSVMGGTIGASSIEGKGSTFWVRLPVALPSSTPIA